jgi:Transglutaminase-like superfamily
MSRPGRLSLGEKLRLAARIWLRFVRVRLAVDREPLPAFVSELGGTGTSPPPARHPPATLSAAIYRCLRVGGRRPRCLINALVLFRLLREQGEQAELVIGLPEAASDHRAHAWVELAGSDVGPPPGRAGHREIARFS